MPVLALIGPDAAKRFLLDLVDSRFALRPAETVELVQCLHEEQSGLASRAWEDSLRDGVRAVLRAVPAALSRPSVDEHDRLEPPIRLRTISPPRKQIGDRTIRDVFALAGRWGLTIEADAAARAVADQPQAIPPDRLLPTALRKLSEEEGLANTAAYTTLWHHATAFLLARSACPPEEPRDWSIAVDVDCPCELCEKLRAFCRDPETRTARFPLRKDLRAHLHETIDRHRLDINHVTERLGRPFTLVCTKNRTSHRRRLIEYSVDISCMRTLLRSAPGAEQSRTYGPMLSRLHAAVSAAG